LSTNGVQGAGLYAGWELVFRLPRTATWLFNKVKYKELKLGFIRRDPNHSTEELLLLIAPISIPHY